MIGSASASPPAPGPRSRLIAAAVRAATLLRGPALWLLMAGALALGLREGAVWWGLETDNRTIAALRSGHDLTVGPDAADAVAYARLDFLLFRDRLDEAEPFVERLARSRDDGLAAEALLAAGNARMRRAIDLVEAGRIDDAIPFVGLAKRRYMEGLRRRPGHWSLKYDLDVAMRLVRDFPELEVTGDDDVPATPKKLWTELPGLPKGLP